MRPHLRAVVVGIEIVRADSVQNRIAERITAFAGSMRVVYVSIICFGCWIGFGVDDYPYAR